MQESELQRREMSTIFTHRPNSSLFLLLLILFFVTSIHTESRSDHIEFPRRVSAGEIRLSSVSRGHGSKRFLLEERNDGNKSSIVLAGERTERKDPLNHFNYYTGGWNISDKHYFASVAYTSAPLVLTAGIWLVAVGIFLVLSCLYFCCCRHRHHGYSKTAYALSLILLILFTIVTIVGTVFLYIGQRRFHHSSTATLGYVVNKSDYIVTNLRNVPPYLNAAKQAGGDQGLLPQNVKDDIDKVVTSIDSSANKLETETKKNKDDIQSILDSVVRHTLLVVASLMLVIALLGFLLSIFGLQILVYILIVIAWIFVAGTFVLSGTFLALHNATSDTCLAMDEWVENPTAHTALDGILPCVDATTAQKSLNQSKDVVYILIQAVNLLITTVPNLNPPPQIPIIYFNQSGPRVPILCNPLNYDRTERICEAGELDLSNATQVWKNYVCQVSKDGLCITVGRLKPGLYDQMASFVNISFGLNHYGPFLADLVDCKIVRDTFNGVIDNHCPKLKKYSEWVYICLSVVSAAIALSLIFWVLYARERRHRKYSHSVEGGNNEDP